MLENMPSNDVDACIIHFRAFLWRRWRDHYDHPRRTWRHFPGLNLESVDGEPQRRNNSPVRKQATEPRRGTWILLWAGRPLPVRDLLRLTGWSRATLYRRIGQDGFPLPIGRNGSKAVWDPQQVRYWISDFNLRLHVTPEEYERRLARRRAIEAHEASLATDAARMAFRRWLWSGKYDG